MADLNLLRSDLTKELEGIWIEYELGIEFLIARTRHPEFKSAITKLERRSRRTKRKSFMETMTDEQSKKIMAPLVSKHILRGWKNITENGKPLKYSEKEALRILMDPELEDIYLFILISASDSEYFRKVEQEEDAGN